MWIKSLAQGNNTCCYWGSNPVPIDLESDVRLGLTRNVVKPTIAGGVTSNPYFDRIEDSGSRLNCLVWIKGLGSKRKCIFEINADS